MDIIRAKSITIEDNVWITMNCIILAGVTIGKNSVVAAGSVVTKSQPPNSLIAGNPAKVVKQIEKTNINKIVDISERHDREKIRIMKILDFIINDIKNKIRIFR